MSGKTVLLIETNLFFSTKLSGGLRKAGYLPAVCSDAEAARSQAGPETEAVILNLSAPGLDSLDTVRKLRAFAETARLPLIGFAGHKDREVFESALRLGCDLAVPNSAAATDLPGLIAKARSIRQG